MGNNSKIRKIKAREILDSRGNPTVEVELETDLGKFFASVPSGASTGKYEAVELRDGGERYGGKGVLRAVKNVNKTIALKLIGKDPTKQEEIDELMKKNDGTENKSKLGANAICGVSMAVCRAGAAAKNLPLYKYIKEIFNFLPLEAGFKLPMPCFNVINGGAHAGNDLDFQEFMLVPQFKNFYENLETAVAISHNLKKLIINKYLDIGANVGDEGGFAPPIRFPEEALDLIGEAANRVNFEGKIKIIIDVAASEFFSKGEYRMKKTKMTFTKNGFLNYYKNLLKKYPIAGLEDPFGQDDWESWKIANKKFGSADFSIIGDDLLVTNPKRIKEAHKKAACNGMILKVNQIGTVSEALEAAKLAKSYGWKIFVKNRSGETNDDFIADLAVGLDADGIMTGAPARGERVAKYNRLLKIEEELKNL